LFFFKVLAWLNRFGLVWFNGFRLWKPNRIGIFLWFFNLLIRFFFGFLGLISYSVFLLISTSNQQ
jgi:hypothetical protein